MTTQACESTKKRLLIPIFARAIRAQKSKAVYDAFMQPIETEAIVLKVVPYKERDAILTLFSLEEGLTKLFCKGRSRPQPRDLALQTALTHARFIYSKGKRDLGQMRGGEILNQHLKLRSSYEKLQVAEEMSHALLQVLNPENPTPALFALFLASLRMVQTLEHPENLLSVFLLKILRYEGLWQESANCSICNDSNPTYRYGGARFCKTCALQGSLECSADDEALLEKLLYSRQLEEIEQLTVTSSPKVLFEQSTSSLV